MYISKIQRQYRPSHHYTYIPKSPQAIYNKLKSTASIPARIRSRRRPKCSLSWAIKRKASWLALLGGWVVARDMGARLLQVEEAGCLFYGPASVRRSSRSDTTLSLALASSCDAVYILLLLSDCLRNNSPSSSSSFSRRPNHTRARKARFRDSDPSFRKLLAAAASLFEAFLIPELLLAFSSVLTFSRLLRDKTFFLLFFFASFAILPSVFALFELHYRYTFC